MYNDMTDSSSFKLHWLVTGACIRAVAAYLSTDYASSHTRAVPARPPPPPPPKPVQCERSSGSSHGRSVCRSSWAALLNVSRQHPETENISSEASSMLLARFACHEND
eukprot:461423-Amphidinium_carterae.1